MSDVEKIVRDFYDNYGWVRTSGQSGEDQLFRQFSPPYYEYHRGTINRTVSCFSRLTGKLLIAGGGDLPETHITIAERFGEVCCLDISQRALDIAKDKLGPKARYVLGTILDIRYPDSSFDAVFCAHVIYHIDIQMQEKAINELIRVTKKGGRIVVIYGNPDSLAERIARRKARTPLLWRLRRSMESSPDDQAALTASRPPLYAAHHPLNWWKRFDSECTITVLPWDVMGNSQERALLWNDRVASGVYRICAWFEKKHPALAAKWWSYPMIILDKDPG